jgi:hypothetical protein
MSEGFLSRWSRRKEAVREGKPVETEPVPAPEAAAEALPSVDPSLPPAAQDDEPAAAPPEPPPTLEDVQSLTPESDFTRFTRADVAPEVKNAAFRKMFTDPHFNRMDGLDVYIDDYGKPDPLPASMARQLASAQFLKLFSADEEKAQSHASRGGREVEHDPQARTVAQSQPDEHAVSPPPQDADPDLRLQQDHAPGPPGPGQGTG